MKILRPIKLKIKPNNLEVFALLFLNPYAQDIETICGIPFLRIRSGKWDIFLGVGKHSCMGREGTRTYVF